MERDLRAGRVTVALGAGLVLLVAGPASAAPGQPGVGAGRCGNGEIDRNEQCDQNNLDGQSCESLGFDGGDLSCGANCQLDTSACIEPACGNGFLSAGEECEVGSPPASCGDLGEGFGTAQCGPGCTYDTSACSAERFVDNGDGTVSDFQAGLMWEKKVEGESSSFDDQGVGDCLNCVDDFYNWTTAMSEWISALNGRTDDPSTQVGFAGHEDWRFPTIVELGTIVDTSTPGCGQDLFSRCIDPIFGPTSGGYWSATSDEDDPSSAWGALFHDGSVREFDKAFVGNVRAARGGSE